MNKITTSLLLAGLVAAISSCAKKEDPVTEPVKQPVKANKAAPAPVAVVNPTNPTSATNPFRTPEDDLNLPTAAQTEEGRDSSIGSGGQSVSDPDNAPSLVVTPPAPAVTPATPKATVPDTPQKKEDRLDAE